jgi:Zn-dependent peptidase ImmA (M78 family)
VNTNPQDKPESEANAFAMALLMPEEMIRKEVRKLKGIDLCDDTKIRILAKKFQVPLTLMSLRLGQIYRL